MTISWFLRAPRVLVVAALLAGLVSTALPQETTGVPAPNPSATGSDSSAAQAFVDGYRAYQNHDLAAAVDRLGYAAENYPPLRDYALFYLASAETGQGDLAAAAKNFETMVHTYPQSVLAAPAYVTVSDVYLRLTRASDAAAAASRAISIATDPKNEESARMALARATAAEGDPKAAFNEAMTVREMFPHGKHDAEARGLARSLLAANPEIANTETVQYRRSEAALLMKEGQGFEALEEIARAFALGPDPAVRAELTFMKARLLKSDPERAESTYNEYLRLAPSGDHAAAALEAIALIMWHRDERDAARATFTRLITRFPGSELAAGAGRALSAQRVSR